MELNWQFPNKYDATQVESFARELNSSTVLARVLLNRGIADKEAARSFFIPKLENLHDPYLMSGMQKAVQRIRQAVMAEEKILIYGDYDVDGTTATSMLLRFLRGLGAKADYYVPARLSEGYGVSEIGIRTAKRDGFALIVTVDCGITATEEVTLACRLGMDVIICDHHRPAAELPPAYAVLNPKQEICAYPFKELAGVGVAFKLLQALQQAYDLDSKILHDYMEFVAIGSAADIVPMLDENRIFVKHGLHNLKSTEYIGMRALLDSCGLSGQDIGTGQVVFVVAPRINAVGRLGDAGRAVELLTTENMQEAKDIASVLESENRTRREIDEQTFAEACEIIEDSCDPHEERVLVIHKEGWHPGVIGIVASRIVEKYYRPTVMIATENGTGRGSARSIHGFDIYGALKWCESWVEQFGGHKYAAGLTIRHENISGFRDKLNEIASANLTPEMLIPRIWIDDEVRFKDITPDLLKLLNRMGPFGPQNMRPVFVTRNLEVVGTPGIVGKNHLKFKVRQDGIVMDAIGFNLGDLLYRISPGETSVEMVYAIEENEWNNQKRLQLRVKDLR